MTQQDFENKIMRSIEIKELFKRLNGLDQRKADDEIYAQIYDEYTAGIMDKVAQARAMQAGGGNQEKIKSEYIRFRFIRIKDAITELQKAEQEKRAALDAQLKAAKKQKQNAKYENERRREALREEIRNRQKEKDANQYSAFKAKSTRRSFNDNDAFGSEYDRELEKQNRVNEERSQAFRQWIWIVVVPTLILGWLLI